MRSYGLEIVHNCLVQALVAKLKQDCAKNKLSFLIYQSTSPAPKVNWGQRDQGWPFPTCQPDPVEPWPTKCWYHEWKVDSPVEEEEHCVNKIVSTSSNIQLSSSNLAHFIDLSQFHSVPKWPVYGRAFVEKSPSKARIFVILPVYMWFWARSEGICHWEPAWELLLTFRWSFERLNTSIHLILWCPPWPAKLKTNFAQFWLFWQI